MVFDMQTQFNPMTNKMGAQIDNPIFSDASSNIEIVRKPDLSNQTLLENINTPKIEDIQLDVNEPAVNELAKYVNEIDLMAVADEESNNYREVIKTNEFKKEMERNTERMKQKKKLQDPNKTNEQEFLTVEKTPEKQKERSKSVSEK